MNWWPFSRRRELVPGHASEEATHSAATASRHLQDAEAMSARADAVADRLSKTRERNHFGESLSIAMSRKARET